MLFEKIKLVNEAFEVVQDAYLETCGDRITYIGMSRPENYEGEVINGHNKLLIPGFYNTHCHVPMTLLRGYGEGLQLYDWLHTKIFPFEAKMTGSDIYYGALLGIMEQLASGIVSFSDMYFEILDIARAVEDSGIKANLCHGLSSFEDNPVLHTMKGYKDTMELRRLQKSDGKIIADMGLHAEYTSNESLVRQVAEAALDNKMLVHTHISESIDEHNACKARHAGMTPTKYFESCGLFKSRVQAAHCVFVEEEDMDIILNSGSSVSHCISSNLKLGSGIAPIAHMCDRGINVVVATDGASSNNNLNLFEEMHIASMAAKGNFKNPVALSAGQTLKMATINGAMAQGRTDCGSLKVGNKADIVMIDLNQPHLQPDYDSLANLVYSAQSSDVCMTMVDGEILYKSGEFLSLDKEKIIYEIKRRHSDILSRL